MTRHIGDVCTGWRPAVKHRVISSYANRYERNNRRKG